MWEWKASELDGKQNNAEGEDIRFDSVIRYDGVSPKVQLFRGEIALCSAYLVDLLVRRSDETKVSQLEKAVISNEDIVGLDV